MVDKSEQIWHGGKHGLGKVFEGHHFNPVRKEGDYGTRQQCRIVSSQRGGYSVILANGKTAFLHSQKQYLLDDQVEVMILQVVDRIIVTDEEKSFGGWPQTPHIGLKFFAPHVEIEDEK